MEFFLIAAALAFYGGSIWAAVSYTRKAIEAAHQVKLADQKPVKRAYNRKAAVAKAKVAAVSIVPATGLPEAGKQALNGQSTPYTNGHAKTDGAVGIFE